MGLKDGSQSQSSNHSVKILFLDQSGKLGGAELCLLDLAAAYRASCLVGLFADGAFRTRLEQQQIPVRVLTTKSINVRKESGILQGIASLGQLVPLIAQVAQAAHNYDLIYANTQKALVVGAIASQIARRPLVYHLHDILSTDHFSSINRRIAVMLANRASFVIANSQASQLAFLKAGGNPTRVEVIYNGFELSHYQQPAISREQMRQQLELDDKFVVGHFSRLSPWKGQDVLVQALTQCPDEVVALLVGDALFGEQDYVQQLRSQVSALGLSHRVKFLGFQSDVVSLMNACDLVAHTSTAPEPFGRVIVEAMLCGRPVVAAAAGGAIELVEPNKTGWLTAPGDISALVAAIKHCRTHPEQAMTIAQTAQAYATERFNLDSVHQQINAHLQQVVSRT